MNLAKDFIDYTIEQGHSNLYEVRKDIDKLLINFFEIRTWVDKITESDKHCLRKSA